MGDTNDPASEVIRRDLTGVRLDEHNLTGDLTEIVLRFGGATRERRRRVVCQKRKSRKVGQKIRWVYGVSIDPCYLSVGLYTYIYYMTICPYVYNYNMRVCF